MPPPSHHVGPGGFHLFFGLLLNLGFEPVRDSPQKVIWLGGSLFGRPSREGQGDLELEGPPDYPILNQLLFKRAAPEFSRQSQQRS